MSVSFEGRVAIVTGAGAGLGRCHALGLAERGAKVVVNDLGVATDGSGSGSDAARAVVEEIRAAGGHAIANGADVTSADDTRKMVDEAIAEFGHVDILVNNAGILRDKSFAKMDLSDFAKVLDVHLMGTVNCCKAVWTHMAAREYGRIVVTTSCSGMYGNFGQSNYGAAKAGVVGLMNTLAIEGAKKNVLVNAVSPGLVVTPLTAPAMDIPGVKDDYVANTPLGRPGTPEEVAAAVSWLCSEESSWMTGEVMDLNGGAHTQRYPDLLGHVNRMLGT